MKILQPAVGLFLTVFSVSVFAQKATLNLSKDQKFKVETITDIKSSFSVMGQDMENQVNTKSTTSFAVLNKTGNDYEIGETITKMVSNVQMMGQEMSYDSDKKDNSGPTAEAMGKLLNKEKKVSVSSIGMVTKIDKAEKEEEADPMSMLSGGASSIGGAFFNKSVLNKEIQLNASWMDSTEEQNGKMKTKSVLTFIVKKIENGIATINFEGNSTNSGTIEQMGNEMAMTGTNKVEGSMELNLTTGVIQQSTYKANGTSTVEAAGMSIPVSSTVLITTKMIE